MLSEGKQSVIRIADDDLTCYDLLLGRDCLVALKEEVAEGARKRQISVDPIELHPTASPVNAIHFIRIVRLVIVAERHQCAVSTGDGARVTGIGTIQLVVLYQNGDRRRSGHLLFDRLIVVHCRVTFEKSLQSEAK